jgi:outer membrane protein OmpA-like peptidoglycan-associated protein
MKKKATRHNEFIKLRERAGSMITIRGLSKILLKGLLVWGTTAGVGFGAPAPASAQPVMDKFVSEEEFSALFDPDPAEAMKKRGVAKVPRPGFDSKKREVTTYVLFETGSMLLRSPESFQQLDAAGRAFKNALEVGKADKWIVEIAGHTDNVGSPEANMKLSKERAESVRQYLLQVYGLPQNMIVAQGYGETQPIASNDAPDGREKNRRVVFRITPR